MKKNIFFFALFSFVSSLYLVTASYSLFILAPKCNENMTLKADKLNNLKRYLDDNEEYFKRAAEVPVTEDMAEWHELLKEKIKDLGLKPTPFQEIRDDARTNELDQVKITFETVLPNIEIFKRNLAKGGTELESFLLPGTLVDSKMNVDRIVPYKMDIMQQCRYLGEQIQDIKDTINQRIDVYINLSNSEKRNNTMDIRLNKIEDDIGLIKKKLNLR